MYLSDINQCASSSTLSYLSVHFDCEKSLDSKKYKRTVSLRSVCVHNINVFTILCMQVNLKKNHSFIAVRVICCEKRQVTSLSSPDEWYVSFQAKTKRLSDS